MDHKRTGNNSRLSAAETPRSSNKISRSDPPDSNTQRHGRRPRNAGPDRECFSRRYDHCLALRRRLCSNAPAGSRNETERRGPSHCITAKVRRKHRGDQHCTKAPLPGQGRQTRCETVSGNCVESDNFRRCWRQIGSHSVRAYGSRSNDLLRCQTSSSEISCLAAAEAMTKAGYRTQTLSIQFAGEAREAGRIFGAIARDIRDIAPAFAPPAALVAGGETTVTVRGKGKGGRNQELVLAAATKISGSDGVVVGSFATDGIEGQTNAAGAFADGTTVMRGLELGMYPEQFLRNNDSYHYFSKLKDLVITGPTGTNVNDITILAARR